MNKLFTKIAALALGAAMVVGVGVSAGSNSKATTAEAATNTVTFSGKDFANSSSWTYNGSTSGYDSSKGVTIYKADNGGVLTSPSFTNVTGVSVVYSSSSKGVASFSTKVGSGTAQSSGSISKSQTNTTKSLYSSSGESGVITITISCTTSTLFVKSFTITTTGGTGYTVSFNANGGTGNMDNETGISGSYQLPACGFTAPSNKDFAGWKPNNTGDTVYAAGASYTISAATEFYAQWVDHQTNRKYTVASTSEVTESGDTMTGTSSTFLNTFTTKDQISAGNSMTLTITGMTKKVNINKLVFSMHSNSGNGSGYVTIAIDGGTAVYLSGNSSGVEFTSFGDDGTTYGTDYRDITWDDLDYTASSSIVIVIASTYKSLYCQSFDIFFSESENTDLVSALSVSPATWSGYDSGTLDVSDFTVSVTKNGNPGTAADYEYLGIGYMNNTTFVARDANFSSGHPTTADTRLCWKAKYPQTAGQSDYLYAYVTLTVTADSISSIALSGTMTTTSYALGGSWSSAGLVVTATYASSNTEPLTSDLTFNYYSDSDCENELLTPDDLGVCTNTQIYVKATYSGVTPSKISAAYAQTVSVSKEPGTIHFGSTDGYWAPSASGETSTDSFGNTVQITSNEGASYSQTGSDYKQVGTNNNKATSVLITVTFSERVGVEGLSIKYGGASSKSNHDVLVYGDTVNDVIYSGSISGSTTYEESTGSSYETINADSITVKFTGNVSDCGGIKIFYISYLLGDTVQEFGTLASIAIASTSAHETQFKVGETFSSAGLVITATDTVGFTKDFTNGFTTSKDGVTFTATATHVENVVTLELGEESATCSYYFDVITIPTYTLASASDIYDGMKVIIGYDNEVDKIFTAGALSGAYFAEVDAVLENDEIKAGTGTLEFTIQYYGDKITLLNGGKYLKHSGDKSVTLVAEFDSACTWIYDGSSLQNESAPSYFLQYNTNSPRFTTYTGSQKDVGLYISSATPKTDVLEAQTFQYKYLHMRDYLGEEGSDGSGYCKNTGEGTGKNYFTDAVTYYSGSSMSADARVKFGTTSDFAEARKRLIDWGKANSKNVVFDATTGEITVTQIGMSLISNIFASPESTSITVIIIVSVIGVSALGGFFFLRKRKEI